MPYRGPWYWSCSSHPALLVAIMEQSLVHGGPTQPCCCLVVGPLFLSQPEALSPHIQASLSSQDHEAGMKPPLLAIEAGDMLSQPWQTAVSATLIARRARCSSSPAATVLCQVKLFLAEGQDLAFTRCKSRRFSNRRPQGILSVQRLVSIDSKPAIAKAAFAERKGW